MKKWILLVGIFASHVALAICPSLEAIKKVGITKAYRGSTDDFVLKTWHAFSINKFDTNENWILFIALPEADSEKDCLKRGHEILMLLNFVDGPRQVGNKAEWMCIYTDLESGYIFQAVTKEIQ